MISIWKSNDMRSSKPYTFGKELLVFCDGLAVIKRHMMKENVYIGQKLKTLKDEYVTVEKIVQEFIFVNYDGKLCRKRWSAIGSELFVCEKENTVVLSASEKRLETSRTKSADVSKRLTTERNLTEKKVPESIATSGEQQTKETKVKDVSMLQLIRDAFAGDREALVSLGDGFLRGTFGSPNPALSSYIHKLAKGEKPHAINQYMVAAVTFNHRESRAEIYEHEQKHLNGVLEKIREEIEQLENQIESGFSAYFLPTDVQLDKFRKKDRIVQLHNLTQRPYYARLDVTSRNKLETYYIGEKEFSPEVISVWSEFGRHYRNSRELTFEVKGQDYGVTLRRKIDIQNGTLVDIVDEYNKDAEEQNEIFDPFLHKVLEEKRGESGISNIIRSIQKKQNDIIDFDFDKNLIVQGCAGSGKTMILLHRLANMKYNRPVLNWDTVKIITPNENFNSYIDDISRDLEIDKIERVTLPEYYIILMGRYHKEHHGRGVFEKRASTNIRVTRKNKEGEEKNRRNKSIADKERDTIHSDIEIDNRIATYLYSERFSKALKTKIDSMNKGKYFDDAIITLYWEIFVLLSSEGFPLSKYGLVSGKLAVQVLLLAGYSGIIISTAFHGSISFVFIKVIGPADISVNPFWSFTNVICRAFLCVHLGVPLRTILLAEGCIQENQDGQFYCQHHALPRHSESSLLITD